MDEAQGAGGVRRERPATLGVFRNAQLCPATLSSESVERRFRITKA
jgi:hypothetical protein